MLPSYSASRHLAKVLSDWIRYFSFHLFDRIEANGGFFVSRAKTHFNPLIVGVHRTWRGRAVDVVGQRLRDILPLLRRELLEVEVEVGFKKRAYKGKRSTKRRTFRLVAVRNDETGQYPAYITNVPADRLPAEDIAQTYALRWQVEMLFKAMKSHGHRPAPQLQALRGGVPGVRPGSCHPGPSGPVPGGPEGGGRQSPHAHLARA